MRSHRLAATVLLTALLLGLLPAIGVAGPADVSLVPPAGQTAIKGDDVISIDGTADADASVQSGTLRALDANGNTLGAYDFNGRVTNNGGTLSGSFKLACGFIPGCLEGDGDLRASIDRYRLELTLTSDHTHEIVSPEVEFDEVDPFIVGYFLIAPNQVEVRFSEDVADPQGDTVSDWTIDGLPPVTISGEGDRRVLQTTTSFGEDDTPEVRYRSQTGLGSTVRNEPYLDEAGNDLLARNRFSEAADRIAPDPPSIDAINGTATSRDGDDQAVPVPGSDPTPTVTIGSIEDGHTARLWLDDGDGTLEDDRDTRIGDAVASGGSAEIIWPEDLALPDDVHRLFARALDGAACDPGDSSQGSCPNASARSQDALYDLDTTAPTLVHPALASTSAVTVVLSEPVAGPNNADDWTITNADSTPGPEVTGVSGSGDSRVLQAEGVLPGATLTYAPTGDRYADDHDNELQDGTVGIVAQPLPVVHLVDAEPVEEKDGPAPPIDPLYQEATATFRVELSEAPRPGETVTVTLEVVDDTATAGSDYTDPGEITVEFSGDETGADVAVELIGDTLDEFDETLELRVTGTTNAEVADETATGTIIDDDPLVNLSVADATVAEGAVAEVTASIDAPSGKDVSAEWSLVEGTAAAGDDYEVATASLTIPAGETSTTVEITTLQDQLDEADETFELVLRNAVNTNLADDTAVVTITDDDATPSLRISDLETFEGDDTRTEQLVVTLSEASGRDVTVAWATADGSATTADGDYTGDSGTLTIPAGATSGRIDVEILGDTDGENDETFTVELSGPTNAEIDKGTGTVTLLDDDGGVAPPPDITMSVTGGEIGEGDALLPLLFPAEVTWTVTLSEPARGPIQVSYRTTDDGTATTGEDFEEAVGTLEIPAGETEGTITTEVIDDDLQEDDETVALQVDDPVGAVLVDDADQPVEQLTTMATIIDDDAPPTVAFADGSDAVVVNEGDDATFTVELDTASGRDVTVDWATVFDGTATTADLPSQSDTVTIPAGDITATFTVTTIDDSEEEGDETVTIELSNPSAAELADDRPTTSQLTLADDESPIPTITLTPGEGDEDPGVLPPITSPTPVEFLVKLSETSDDEVTVDYRTTMAGSATAGSDFTATSGTLTIPAGEASATIEVTVLDDELNELDETVELVLSNPVRARLDGGVAELAGMGTILDDDPLPTVAFADGSDAVVVNEGDDATFTVELDTASGRDVTVDWATVFDGDATTADLPAQSDAVTIFAGNTTATFTVTTTDDGDEEADETVTIELSNPSAAELADDRPTTSQLTLADDEAALPTITLTPGEGDEDPGALPPLTSPTPVGFLVELDEVSEEDVTVRYRTTNAGDATAESDFTAVSGTLTIPAGEASATIEVPVLDDELDEFDETVELVLSNPVRARLAGGVAELSGMGTIVDDDPLAAVSIADASVDEGEVATLTVTLDTASGKDIQVAYETVDGVGSATAGDDYTSTSGVVEIAAGETEATFTVATIDDAEDEGSSETVPVTIEVTDADTATVDDGTATLTIVDDDTSPAGEDPVVSLTGAVVAEGDPTGPIVLPDTPMTFVVQLSKRAADDVELSYETAETDPVSATEGSLTVDPNTYDYLGTSGTVTIPAGDDSAEITVNVVGDAVDEFNEEFVLRLTGVDGPAELPDGLARTGRITDDDPLAVLGFADGSLDVGVDEGGTVELTVERTGATAKPITVDYAISFDGGASPADAPTQSGTLELAPGESSVSFEIETTQDEIDEPSEAFSVVLSDPTNAALDPDTDVATVTITDDDLVVPVLSVSGGSVDEGAAGTLGGFAPVMITELDPVAPAVIEEDLVFTVTLSEPAEQDVSVQYSTSDGGRARAGSDYVATSDTLTIPAGETTAEITVDVLDDDLDEFDELLEVTFTNPQGVTFSNGASTLRESGTILDDDPLVTANLGDDQEVTEGNPATFEVTLSAVSGKDITLRYRTSNGSATAGQDYQATDKTLTIPAGDTSRTFTIPTLDDSVAESIEDLSVQLSVVEDDTAALGRSSGTLTINDDDLGVDPNDTVVSLTGASVEEGDPATPLPLPLGDSNTLDFDVRLSDPADGDVVIDYETRAGTAAANDDFEPDSGQVTIPDGQRQATVSIAVVPDFLDEFDEDLRLVLTDVSGDAVLPGGQLARTGRIIDDDAEAQLRVSDATVLEGDVAELDVTLDNPSGKDITVDYAFADGSATAGDDYQPDSGTLTFPAGTTSRTVQVATLGDDDTGELIEQFELVLSNATNAGIDDGRGTVSIVDIGADGLPTVTAVFLEDVTTQEADTDTTVFVPVRLSSERDQDTTVTWTTQRLTAADGEDYRADGGQVTIPAGATSAQIAITIIGDDEVEPNEDFLVVLTQAEGAVITGPTGRVTIEDDDDDSDGATDGDGDGSDDGGDPGGGDDADGAPDGGDQGAGQLPATGGGAGVVVFGLALLAARRRREHG